MREPIVATCIAFVIAAAAIGCGARSELSTDRQDAGAPTPSVDAGRPDAAAPPRDAGRPDAGPPDAAVSPSGCALAVIVPPTTIFTDSGGSFAAPQVQLRPDGRLDLLATFLPDTDDRIPSPHAERFDFALRSQGLLDGALSPTGAMFAAAQGDTLGVCYRDLGEGRSALARYALGGPYRADVLDVFGPGRCLGLAGSGDRWLTATVDDGVPTIWLTLWSGTVFGEPTLVSMPWPTFFPDELVDQPRVAVTPFRDPGRFAWVLTGRRSREATVGVARGDLPSIVEVRVGEIPGTPGGAAIAPWAFDRDRLAVAAWAGGLRVIVVDPDGAGEVLRSEPLAFGMFGDTRPALASLDGAMLVAAKGYGDIDPFGGVLEVIAVGRRGEELARITMPTRRGSMLNEGIHAASDGRRAVVHWSEVLDDTDTPIPVTRAMVLQCVPP